MTINGCSWGSVHVLVGDRWRSKQLGTAGWSGRGYGLRSGSRDVSQQPTVSALKASVLFQSLHERWGFRSYLVDSAFTKLKFQLRRHVSCIADEVVS